ncbi:MAG: formylglycine-generating enzyme family protein, partial [Chitinivibrionia bacterium]|nr:formylglycine-generating enzyme family protein [Chitinivibrionia bacterium]
MRNGINKLVAVLLFVVVASAQNVNIGTAQELRDFAAQVNGGNNFSGRTITLSGNIDLSGTPEWVPIGNTETRAFQGTFDGNGRTVSGVKIDNDQDNQAFFGVIGTNGIVRNLGLEVDIIAGGTAAALAAINRGTIEVCKASGNVQGMTVGGLVAENRGTIRNSHSSVATRIWQEIPEFPVVISLPSDPVEGQGVRLRVVHNTISERSTYIDLVYVASGEFQQGGSHFGNNNTRPVRLTQGFWIGRFPITQAQWQVIMGTNPSAFTGAGRENYPITNVRGNDISLFMVAIGARFPTGAEWEFVARGGNRRDPFAWSGSDNANNVAWHSEHPDRIGNHTMPVGLLAPNGLGIFDMSGNVWEFVGDWWEDWGTTNTTTVDPTGATTGTLRVIRGGNWDRNAPEARVASSNVHNMTGNSNTAGFRVAFSSDLNTATTGQTTLANTAIVGGLVGANFGTIENSYSAGIVRNLVFGGSSGGLVGINNGGIITNSFFDSQRSRQPDNDGRGTPLTTAQMRQRTTFAHWDIENIWGMDALMYNGDPFLRALYPLSRAKFTIDGQRTAVSPAPANLISSAMPYTGINLHTGSPIQPNVQIEHNGQPLTLDTDFRLEFNDNTNISPNNNPARMRIIGMGDFAGTMLGYNFFITNAGRAITNATFVPNSINPQLHSINPIEPEIEIRDFGGAVVLQTGVDYILGYGANNTVGTNAGSVSITGMGLFTGNRVMNFNIVAAHSI